MLIGWIASLALAASTPSSHDAAMIAQGPAPSAAPAPGPAAMIGEATDTLLAATPAFDTAEFRNVRIVRLPARHQAVCGEVDGRTGVGFRRFAYDAVTKDAQVDGGDRFAALWANCGS